MPPLAPKATKLAKAFSEPRIVLAIDYGTTFTGLAWMQNDGTSIPELSDLNLFTNWPEKNSIMKNEAKVPSEVSFSLMTESASAHGYRNWGFSIDTGPSTKVLRWTKLELVQDSSPLKQLEILEDLIGGLAQINSLYAEGGYETANVPRHLPRTTKDVIEFYLSNIAKEWVSHVMTQARFALDRVPVDIVITHPAMWPDEARGTLVQAVNGAFSKMFLPTRRNIYVKSEPEACTLFVIQDLIKKHPGSLRTGSCFTLCDAGGGTVDLVSYYLESLMPLHLVRIGDVTGDTIGATAVDRAFLKWLGTKVSSLNIPHMEYGKGGQYILSPHVSLLLRRFEAFKRNFTGSESFELMLPRDTVITSPEEGNDSRSLHITSEEMKGMFSESVEGVKRLIIQQICQVEEESKKGIRCKVSDIFLAGGFAENGHLYEEVKKTAGRFGTIRVQRADDCWSSVVKGAVLSGMAFGAPPPSKITTCPRRHGLILRGGKRPEDEGGYWTIDPSDENGFLANPFSSDNKIMWLLDEGQVIFADNQLQKTVKLSFKSKKLVQTSSITFISNSSENIPTQVSEVENDGDHARYTVTEDAIVRLDRLLPTDFKTWRPTRMKGKEKLFEVLVELQLTVTSIVTVEIKVKDRVIGIYASTSL